jgi:hypothetical protein
MSPFWQAERHDAPRLIGQLVPSVAAVFNDIFLGSEDAIGQPVVADEPPNIFDRFVMATLNC